MVGGVAVFESPFVEEVLEEEEEEEGTETGSRSWTMVWMFPQKEKKSLTFLRFALGEI